MPEQPALPGGGSFEQGAEEAMLSSLAGALFHALPGSEPAPYAAPVSAPLPGATPPGLGSPPPAGGFGAAPVAPDPMAAHLAPAVPGPTPALHTAGASGFDPNALGFDPALLGPAPPPAGGRSISAAPIGEAGQFYFLTGDSLPALDTLQPADPFAEAVPQAAPPPRVTVSATPGSSYDVAAYRADFPILSERVGGKPLVWLDNGATTQKPRAVIERLACFYEHENSNIHRAAHELAARSTDAYEGARETVRRFLGAGTVDEIVFTRGTTEAINLVAQSWGRQNLKAGDAIVLSQLEHHANIVPWVRLSQELGFEIRVAPVDDRGDIILEEYARLLSGPVKFVGFTQVSNALGTVTPAKAMIELAHAAGAVVLLDGAQSVSHMPLDLAALDPDFFVFSGHKIYGPTGIGALYGRKALLDAMPPWQGGGNMIEDVTFEHIRYHGAPMKFEAGTGNIADAVGLGTALDYVLGVGREAICAHEHMLLAYTEMHLRRISGVRIIGEPVQRAGVISFVMDRHEVPAIGRALSKDGIAVRAGHHCAQPILRRMGVEATVRPSFGLYNTTGDVDALVRVIRAI
jgi:cysteine desulfurase/selenocysteine lyase